jgi:LysR family transcriptional regulator, chromosome initiation inhibitor
MNLDSRQLAALVCVAEHGSFSQAARAMQLTLAAVSMRVQALESALGQRLLVRGKRITPTPAGQKLLAHARQVTLLQADVLSDIQGAPTAKGKPWVTLPIAVNADSLSTWFLPGVARVVAQHRVLLDIQVDDQDHTQEALRQGQVVGCVTTQSTPIAGCQAQPLGSMRYRCLAANTLIERWRLPSGKVSLHRMLAHPAVIFNRKDRLQDLFLSTHFHLKDAAYPRHYMPAVDAFEAAIAQGMGWGMVPESLWRVQAALASVGEIFTDTPIDVPLVWVHWAKEPTVAKHLTRAVCEAAALSLQSSSNGASASA